jgi:hypothetical protein
MQTDRAIRTLPLPTGRAYVFFKAELLAVAEPPDRAMAHRKAPLLGQLAAHLLQRQVRLGCDKL